MGRERGEYKRICLRRRRVQANRSKLSDKIGVVRKHGYHNMCTMDAHVDETCALIHRRYNIINKKVKLPILRWIKTSNYVKSVE